MMMAIMMMVVGGDVEDDLEDALCDLHDPGLEGEGDGGVAGAQLDLHQTPDT